MEIGFCKSYHLNIFLRISDHFADYKRLRGGVYFLNSLPLTPSGKVLRRVVRDMVAKMYEEALIEPDS